MVKFIADHYDCRITFPRNFLDVDNMSDGLILSFNRLDWECCLTNFCMYQIYDGLKNVRHTSFFKEVTSFIDDKLLSLIKK